MKTMLIVFFDICGIVHHEFVPRSRPSTQSFPTVEGEHLAKMAGSVACEELDFA
jgi:hypothetical protein